MVDIQVYIDSLESDVLEIDLSYKGLTSLPDLSRFINLQKTMIFIEKYGHEVCCKNTKLFYKF
jgi:hypothetical protein